MLISSWQELVAHVESVPELEDGQLQVWQMSVSSAHGWLPELKSLLTADECARAARFHFERDHDCYVTSRAVLRLLAARYTGGRPEQIQFRYGTQGKPALANPGARDLRFNVSHSGDTVLFAFASGLEVGVDVEQMHDNVDFAGLAKTSFSPFELDAVLALAPQHRVNLFYEYWTCKEACIKADGRGLSVPLDQFSIIGSSKGTCWRSVATAKHEVFHAALSVRVLETFPGYAVAVAAAGNHWDVVKIDVAIRNPT